MAAQNELADFLRARRERLTPEQVGLPVHGRRRTPGLRREEVATLAGVSIDYLVRLEQGRDTNPSSAVLASLAKALQLSDDDRLHLGMLVMRTNHGEMCPTARELPTEVRPTVRRMLDQLGPIPAHVQGPLGDVLASNASWQVLMRDTGLLDESVPSLPAFVFLDAAAPHVFADWDTVADAEVGRLRPAQPRWGDEPRFQLLVAALEQAPAFVTRWEAHAVEVRPRAITRVMHTEVGELRLVSEALVLADDDLRLVSWVPSDDVSEQALREILSLHDPVSPARLRIVGDA